MTERVESFSYAQRRALMGAEQTPHGLRLNPDQVNTNTAVALLDREVVTAYTQDPDTGSWFHWLTPKGERVRRVLLELAKGPVQPVKVCPAVSRSGLCGHRAAWAVTWQKPDGSWQGELCCPTHLAGAADAAAKISGGRVSLTRVQRKD